jgi:protein-tyrosine phosphatase
MRPAIPDLLWIGNAHDARDVESVLAAGVRAIVDLAANYPAIQYPRDIVYCRLPLVDGEGNDPAIVRLAIASTAEFIRSKVPTLVACGAGMSRAPSIAAAALALVERQSPDEALCRIASSGPHDVTPSLWAEVKRILESMTT